MSRTTGLSLILLPLSLFRGETRARLFAFFLRSPSVSTRRAFSGFGQAQHLAHLHKPFDFIIEYDPPNRLKSAEFESVLCLKRANEEPVEIGSIPSLPGPGGRSLISIRVGHLQLTINARLENTPQKMDRQIMHCVRIPTQIDTHSGCKSTLVPIEIGTCSDANRHPCLGWAKRSDAG